MTTYTATYSPDDNKLRLYASSRLDAETYARVKGAGFKWAPQQELFVAPMWTPERADLLIELAGEIEDDDGSLVERAEERAERFEDYSESRTKDAHRAREAVAAIADNIPLGQPILIGHHSERHARKDAQRIESGMRKAVQMWETAKYWQQRAKGALRHAKYKERPDVRERRIKGLEADQRKQQKNKAEAELFLKMWSSDTLTLERAQGIANHDHISHCFTLAEYPRTAPASTYEGYMSLWSAMDSGIINEQQARSIAIPTHQRCIERATRWLAHIANRLAYERAMLDDSGGTVAQRTGPEKGGGCKCWASPRGGWSYIRKVNKVSVTVEDNWGNGGANFTRTIPFDKLSSILTAAQVEQARTDGRLVESGDGTGFGLLDAPTPKPRTNEEKTADNIAFEKMRETIKAGIEVVTAPQLFPTPGHLAERMADEAGLQDGQRILEPSAGTGNILRAIADRVNLEACTVHAVEVNHALAEQLQSRFLGVRVHRQDFMTVGMHDYRPFDRIIMNPPFAGASDVAHILHALTMLKPGGILVAICADGPRQNERLRPLAQSWESLPSDTFQEQGTSVRTALAVFTK